MKGLIIAGLLYSLLLLSCSGRKDNSIITIQLGKSDYVEKINIEGTIQAVVNIPVLPPRRMFGQMTVLRLAEDGAKVKEGDTICVLAVLELENMYKGVITSIETMEAEIKKTEADNQLNIALLEAQLATSEAQLQISYLDSLHMKYATNVERRLMELEMKKALIEKQRTEKKLAATRMIGETEIRQIKARIMQEKTRAQAMSDQLNSLTIIAQRDGLVMRTESPRFTVIGPQGLGTLGGPIMEGSVLFLDTPVLQFPDLEKMQVSAEVMEADFRKIEKGQKVNIIVDASNSLKTTGNINRKSLMGKTAQRYSDSKVKFYEVIIDIDSCHSKIKPGLSAHCVVTLKEELDTLSVPTLAVFQKDSTRVVYVKEKGYFRPVLVGTGLSGSSYTIITSGLKGDEIIALSEPPRNLILSPEKKTVQNKTNEKDINNQNPDL